MTRFALLLLVPLVAGCDIHANKDRDNDNVTIHSDQSGNVSFNFPFAKGQVKLPESWMHGGNVDIDGVKLMRGSQVTGFNLDSQNDVSNVEMAFSAPASPDQVRSYFVDEFRKQGVTATVSGNAVTGTSKDGNPFRIEVGPAGSGSQGKIVIRDHDKR
jgi:hypothetical protein